ncbi:MAG: hypothetical protein WCP55_09235, partial [Lentisphaerota bacterium]
TPNITNVRCRKSNNRSCCMLGTVYALDPLDKDINREEKYFDYDYAAAHLHAKVSQCTDLRICKPRGYRRFSLWGIPPGK